jgi:BMFP domain-containing protein YqiC
MPKLRAGVDVKQAATRRAQPKVDAKAVIRDRVVELRRVPAADLKANPANWRRHPEGQRAVLRAIIDDIGFVGAVVARETKDGLELLDGHLRADLEPDAELPVLIVDLNDEESAKLLATYHPVGDLAVPDSEALAALLSGTDFSEYADLRKLHADLAAALQKVSRDIEEQPKETTEHEVPGMDLAPHEHYDYLVVLATTTQEWNTLCDRLRLEPVKRRGRIGTSRAIRADRLLKALNGA